MDFSAANWPRTAHALAKGKDVADYIGVHADRAARNINVYRAASHWNCSHGGIGMHYGTDTWGVFAAHQGFHILDQDRPRPPLQRKEDLATCDSFTYLYVNRALDYAQRVPTNNLAILHRLAMYRLGILGDKSVAESLAYSRRASLKLHPDRCADLKGWDSPGTIYAVDDPPGTIVEHAVIGAANLFRAHNSFKNVLAHPHYAKLLYAKTTLLGGQLTVGHLAQDLALFTAVGVAVCLARAKSCAAMLVGSSGCFAALIAVQIFCVVRKKVRDARLKRTHQMVLYMPVYSGAQTRGVR